MAQDTHSIPNGVDGGTQRRDGAKARPKRIRDNINPAAPSGIWCLSTPCGNVSSQWLREHHPYDLAGQSPHGLFLVLPLLAAWAFPWQVFQVPGIGIANLLCSPLCLCLSMLPVSHSAYLQMWHQAADAKLCCSVRSVCLDCRTVESRGNDF